MKVSSLPGIEVSGVAYDSRRVQPGDVFVALKGLKATGTEYASEAIRRGAVAIVSDQPSTTAASVPWITVPDARGAMATLAAELYSHPSRAMQVVGITGTNGKTTTAYLLRAVFDAAGKKCEQPAQIWVPSIGVSAAMFYTGNRFPQWRGNLFVGGMARPRLVRLTLDGRRVVGEETLVPQMGRIRDIRQGPDGDIYLVTDNREGKPTPILKIEPVERGAIK